MTQEELKGYKNICNRIKQLDKKIENEKCKEIEIVKGKVVGSSPSFPYIETHMSVEMYEPKQMEESNRKKLRYIYDRDKLINKKEAIEDFIDRIEDLKEQTIFHYIFIEGNTQTEVAEKIGYTQSSISKIMKKYLKDSYNS